MTDRLKDLRRLRRASQVRRCHTIPQVGTTSYTTGQHTHDLLTILLALHPEPSGALLCAAHVHDYAEHGGPGDVPWDARHRWPALKNEVWAAEEVVFTTEIFPALGGRHPKLSDEDRGWLRGADMLEFWLWCLDQRDLGNHHPTLLEWEANAHAALGDPSLPEPIRRAAGTWEEQEEAQDTLDEEAPVESVEQAPRETLAAVKSKILTEDVDGLLRAYDEYGESWCSRGGVGAFHVALARKWDRLERAVAPFLKREVEDPLELALRALPASSGPIDDVRDLRRYLMLAMVRDSVGAVTSKDELRRVLSPRIRNEVEVTGWCEIADPVPWGLLVTFWRDLELSAVRVSYDLWQVHRNTIRQLASLLLLYEAQARLAGVPAALTSHRHNAHPAAEDQASVRAWVEATFPDQPPFQAAAKVLEEAHELFCAVIVATYGEDHYVTPQARTLAAKSIENLRDVCRCLITIDRGDAYDHCSAVNMELGDVGVSLLSAAGACGADLGQCVDEAMAKNRSRRWDAGAALPRHED